ncbi:MAG: carbohydrate ABC transporter permease [Desulfobacterales bacterium]
MREERVKKILKSAGVVFLLLFCLLPFVWVVVVSLVKEPDFLLAQVAFEVTFDNYSDVLTAGSLHLLDYLRNSLIVSAVAALAATLCASLAAYAITRLTFPGRLLIPLVLLAFSMFPQISIVGYLFKMMIGLGWINTYAGLIFPYITLGLPLALWIMLSYFSEISTELDRAALVDGATRIQILHKIILPLAAPGALSATLLVFIYSFNEFLFAMMLTTDYRARTIPVGIAFFEGLHGQIPWGHLMAVAVISVVPVILLAAVFQRKIIRGLLQGAIKG